jgi:phage terminase large subunit
METSPVFEWNYNVPADKKIIINQGGTSSGKTYSILQVLGVLCAAKSYICTIAGQDVPNLKAGAMRDWEERILADCPEIRAYIASVNRTDRKWVFKSGGIMEFKSYKDAQDAKSGKRDLLFVNEAQGIPYDVARELILRTSQRVYVDYNPNAEFWVHEELLPRPDAIRFISNYTHNPFLSESIVHEIELLRAEPMLWRVYGQGYTGKITGVIFPNVQYAQEWPTSLDREAYGLDFGFTNDPTALVRLGTSDGAIYGQELIYQRGLVLDDLADKMRQAGVKPHEQIWADASNPLAIATLRRAGFNIRAARKGADSVKTGIDLLKNYPIHLHTSSRNWKDEANKYIWNPKDPTRPVDFANHCWDAARYWAIEKLNKSVNPVY